MPQISELDRLDISGANNEDCKPNIFQFDSNSRTFQGFEVLTAIALEVFGVEGRRVLAAPAASSRAAEATREVK